jgi:uncharacterized protein
MARVLSDAQTLEQQAFMTKVYGWMTLGLLISAAMSVIAAYNPHIAKTIINTKWLLYGLFAVELIVVFVIAGLLDKISVFQAGFLFVFYAALNGVVLSVIFSVFSISSILSIFFITAGTFGVMSVYGYITKTDLTKIGNILIMALFGLVLATIIDLFIRNNLTNLILAWIGVVVFVGLTAYDTQKIKALCMPGESKTEEKKEAINGALTLYLDFINLFLDLLRIFGKRD